MQWYSGEYFDQETDSYYLRARYYDPAFGRFISEDTHWNTDNMIYGDNPVKINERENPYNPNNSVTFAYSPNINAVLQSGNGYNYCMNAPLYYVDFNGKFVISISSSLIAAFVAACGIVLTVAAEMCYQTLSDYSTPNVPIKYSLDAALAIAMKFLINASTTSTPPPPNDPNSKGTQINSKTLYNKNGVRIDVENPGNRIGQVHIQQGNEKYIYDVSKQAFRTAKGDLAPKAVQKLLENPDIIKAISRGLKYLGY